MKKGKRPLTPSGVPDTKHRRLSKDEGKSCVLRKPRYSEQILPVPWHFIISRFHCTSRHGKVIKIGLYY